LNYYANHYSRTITRSIESRIELPATVPPAGGFTFSTWFKPSSLAFVNNPNAGVGVISAWKPQGGSQFYQFWVTQAGNLHITMGSTATLDTTNTPVSAGSWYHVAFTWDGTQSSSNLKIYVNGTLQATGGGSFTVPTSAITLWLGAQNAGGSSSADNAIDGLLDDFRIYSRGLSATDIATLAAGNQPHTSSGSLTLAGNLSLSGSLTLNTGTFDVSSSSYNITASGSWLNNEGFFTKRSGTVTFSGRTSGQEIRSGSQSFQKLTLNGTSGSWTLDDPLSLSGSLTFTAGTLNAGTGSYTITLSGSFLNPGGTFTSRSGSVVLMGRNQSVTGSNTLYTLTKTLPSSTFDVLSFGAGNTQTIRGTLTLKATSCTNPLYLRSTSPGTQWFINAPTNSLAYLDVWDSNNTNATALRTTGNNRANNTNWTFTTDCDQGTGSNAGASTNGNSGGGGGEGVSRSVPVKQNTPPPPKTPPAQQVQEHRQERLTLAAAVKARREARMQKNQKASASLSRSAPRTTPRH